MSDRDTLAVIAEELGQAFQPLTIAFGSPGAFSCFMVELGWEFSAIPLTMQSLADAASAIEQVLDCGEIDIGNVHEITDAIRAFVVATDSLQSGGAGLPPSVDAGTFAKEFPIQLIDYLAIGYLLGRQPEFGTFLRLLGIIRLEEIPANGKRLKYLKRSISWEDLAGVLANPGAVIRKAYRWGASDFQGAAFLCSLAALLDAWRLPRDLESPDATLGAFLTKDTLASDAIQDWILRVPLVEDLSSGGDVIEAGLGLFVLPETQNDKPGLSILPYGRGKIAERFEITENLALVFEGVSDVTSGMGILVRPDKPVKLVIDIKTGAKEVANLAASLVARASGDTKLVLLGSSEASRFEVGSVSLTFGGRTDSMGQKEAFVESALDGAAIVIKPSDADGFVATLLPKAGFTIDFDLLVGLSTQRGFYFGGSGALEISLPVHFSIGPIEIQSAVIAIKVEDRKIPVELGATIKGSLGPLQAIVENIGFKVTFTFPVDRKGTVGPVDVAMGFKPPKGVGLSIDAGVIKGGGYLYFDTEKEEYAGAMELVFSGFLTLNAIGLVTTRMPDGSKDFSLLVIITAEFGPGIQLGFGFTLIGVGGLLGLNRTIKLQPLADGVRTGAVNNILFPKDVVANAPRIISDLRTIFPPFKGKFLIGPMAKLGWGSPPLITLSLGIIIEIPGNLAILGVLKCILPEENAPVLVFQVAFVGAIEFDKKRLWLFAGIFDSKVLTFTLEGEMGVLFTWGDSADFVLSVGGFHPCFKPPPLPFPSPKRLTLTILDTDQARIRASCYFAVTTNTVQYGAHAELFFGFSDLSVVGNIQFDTLFQFSPFYFITEMSASVSLKVSGMGVYSISLDMALEGPTPWHARGRGSISFFFFDISVNFDETWGEEKDTTLPPINVFPILAKELDKEPNWSALPPNSGNLLVSMRVTGETKEFVLHPVGTLRVTQRAVPLNSTIDLFGVQKPADANHFVLALKTPSLKIAENMVREDFAPAQFHTMSRNEKLSAPAFATEDGGVDITAKGDQLRSSLVVRRIVRYEQIILDTNYKRFQTKFMKFTGSLFRHFLGGNSMARSTLSAQLKNQMQPFKEVITTETERFGVANMSNNTMVPGTKEFGSYHAAKEYLDRAIANNPEFSGTMHVVSEFELRKVRKAS